MSRKTQSPSEIVDALEAIYADAVSSLKTALVAFLQEGTPPAEGLREAGAFCYPELVIRYDPDGPPPPISRSFGKMSEAGIYASTITRPDFFREYLIEQLTPLLHDYDVDVEGDLESEE